MHAACFGRSTILIRPDLFGNEKVHYRFNALHVSVGERVRPTLGSKLGIPNAHTRRGGAFLDEGVDDGSPGTCFTLNRARCGSLASVTYEAIHIGTRFRAGLPVAQMRIAGDAPDESTKVAVETLKRRCYMRIFVRSCVT